jgi:hypothetical protein
MQFVGKGNHEPRAKVVAEVVVQGIGHSRGAISQSLMDESHNGFEYC